MALIPIEERVEPPADEVYNVSAYGGATRPLAYPVNAIVEEIRSAAEAEGFTDPNLFRIFSGYRSDASQTQLYENKVARLLAENPGMSDSEARRLARKTVAPPGRSSHRTGYAFDIYLGHKPGHKIADASAANVAHIESTPAYAFMRHIAPMYGLTQLPNEPWHWECDRNCRDMYIQRELHTGGLAGTRTSAATGQRVGRALLALSVLSASAWGAWWLISKSRE
jgi:hypothetical protein